MESKNEKYLKDYPSPIFIKSTRVILNQMEKSVYKICLKDGSKGTGFFCKIPLSKEKYLSAFITNNHVINQKYLNEEKEIHIKMDNGYNTTIKKINIKEGFTYTNEVYDITIIELKNINKDDPYEFLEFDEDILNDNGIGYVGNTIYILHYPSHFEESKVAVSYGILKSQSINKTYNFMHFCSTETGSSGSPILNLLNNKVIGVHKEAGKKEYNIGLFAHEAIKDFINQYNDANKNKKKKDINTLPKIKNEIKEKNDITRFNNIFKILKEYKRGDLIDIFQNLYKKKLISDIIPIKKDNNHIIGYQLLISKEFLQKNNSIINKNWKSAWHGTDKKNIESIIKYGFKLPGTKLENGNMIEQNFDIKNKEVEGIKNWEKAIFVSPDIFGASRYSSQNGDFTCLIEVKIRPKCFTKHNREKLVHDFYMNCCNPDEPYSVDYIIYRIPLENDIIVKSVLFIEYSFDGFGLQYMTIEELRKLGYKD